MSKNEKIHKHVVKIANLQLKFLKIENLLGIQNFQSLGHDGWPNKNGCQLGGRQDHIYLRFMAID